MAKVIVIEDDFTYSEYICKLLERGGVQTQKSYSYSSARKLLANMSEDDIVLADLRLPDGNSLDLLKWMKKNHKNQPFIVMTNYADVHTAVESMKLGSKDYIPKQLLEDRLIPIIRNLQKSRYVKTPIFIRQSIEFQTIRRHIRLVAPTDMSVLILGESGTGKEHIARELHYASQRADKPFISVDCGSLSASLASSAFFGHVKGAFTGATDNKTGVFHEAEGGTLFLDEIGNLPYEAQALLLRALQECRYRPVGSQKEHRFNVRIIAATNEKIENVIAAGRFREDLFHRLNEFEIKIPPLRECFDDILPLAEFFLKTANKEFGLNKASFSIKAKKQMRIYKWPGNVRELRNKIRKAVLLAEGETISISNLGLEKAVKESYFGDDNTEKGRILRALNATNNNKALAAKMLQISRSTLYEKMKKHEIEIEKKWFMKKIGGKDVSLKSKIE